MLEKALSQKELSALLGMTTFEIYKKLCWQIEADGLSGSAGCSRSRISKCKSGGGTGDGTL